MTTVQDALADARKACGEGSAAIVAAHEQLAALKVRRGETELRLHEAHEAARIATAGLVSGDGEPAFDDALARIERLQSQLKTYDKHLVPEAEEALRSALECQPSAGRVPALELRADVLARLRPLYDQHKALLEDLAGILDAIHTEHAALRAEHRAAWQTLFSPDRRGALAELLRSVAPTIRQTYGMLFVGYSQEPAQEDRYLTFDHGAMDGFLDKVDREPSEHDLARYNPAARPPAPPQPPEPPRELGPAKWQGSELRAPFAIRSQG